MGTAGRHDWASSFGLAALLLACLLLVAAGSQPGHSSGPKLQRYDLLLPPRGSGPVQYLLRGENGCFTW